MGNLTIKSNYITRVIDPEPAWELKVQVKDIDVVELFKDIDYQGKSVKSLSAARERRTEILYEQGLVSGRSYQPNSNTNKAKVVCRGRPSGSGKSGLRGVSYHKRVDKWAAYIVIKKKSKFLGYYDTPEVASKVYEAKRIELELAKEGENAI